VRLVGARITAGGGVRTRHDTIEITAVNAKDSAADFEWRQPMATGAAIVSESRPHGRIAGDSLWSLRLAPGEKALLRYTIDRPG
jgi:hypothetical protein